MFWISLLFQWGNKVRLPLTKSILEKNLLGRRLRELERVGGQQQQLDPRLLQQHLHTNPTVYQH